ncbi:hypothetical protein DERP_003302 [Dermatophagoides pteronyssinus]|nr:hypothetical protein DERP_003302 [Dermatophagoides pteronyssinus]
MKSDSNSTLSYSRSSRHAKSFRMEKENALATNEVSQFLNTKNIVKTIVKLVFGSSEESTATSRQVLNLLVKVLDMVKTNFAQRRNGRSLANDERGLKDSLDDAAIAGITMMKGFVRSFLATDTKCIQRHICDAASNAARESRELGSVISQIGGYASSYVLDNQKMSPFNSNYDAARIGRSGGDCRKMYSCAESEL